MLENQKIAVMIPVRLNSSRLPGKALLDLGGKPLIERVYENTLSATEWLADKVDIYVCTDSDQIASHLDCIDCKVLITSEKAVNGTERIVEAYTRHCLDYDYVIDVQGDEPFVQKSMISLVLMEANRRTDVKAHIIVPHQLILEREAMRNSTVKIVTNRDNKVLYMSRSLIPGHKIGRCVEYYKKHLSVIGFSRNALLQYSELDPGTTEGPEDIELLRALEAGIPIYSPISDASTFSIDTQHDLIRARKLFKENNSIQL